MADIVEHFFKHGKGLAFVFKARILLRKTAQAYAAAQVVDAGQVLFPMVVKHLYNDHFLNKTQRPSPKVVFFLPVKILPLI